jgi:hypothetical protein
MPPSLKLSPPPVLDAPPVDGSPATPTGFDVPAALLPAAALVAAPPEPPGAEALSLLQGRSPCGFRHVLPSQATPHSTAQSATADHSLSLMPTRYELKHSSAT